MRIILVCDHKWRDLPNLTLIKIQLEKQGAKVLLTSYPDGRNLYSAFKPDAIVFSQMWGKVNENFLVHAKRDGVKVIVLNTEGMGRPQEAKFSYGCLSDWSDVDMMLVWSDDIFDGIQREGTLENGHLVRSGCPRIDFYHPRFSDFVKSRDAFCQHFGLDPKKPIVSLATQFPWASALQQGPDSNLWKKLKREFEEIQLTEVYGKQGIEFETLMETVFHNREKVVSSFLELAESRPDIQFLIKPHPAEDIGYFQNLITLKKLENLTFVTGVYIWDLLNATDVHLHRQCTTSVEAWAFQKPTVEMAMAVDPLGGWDERERGSLHAHDTKSLIQMVGDFISGTLQLPEDVIRHREQHINAWFGPLDGKRCETAANEIVSFLDKLGIQPRSSKGFMFNRFGRAVLRYYLSIPHNVRILSYLLMRSKERRDKSPMFDKLMTRRDRILAEKKLRKILVQEVS